MASLRLTFPEKDEPTVIALTGARLTIGRLPFNTIQIIDRTVSGFHAELISEHGHYRLHDRGSSNGTFVNGQKVADYHLSEPCTITFGTVEAQFSPEAVPASEEAENFPTRSEINAVRKENVELKATVEALREEAHALRLARPLENGDVALAVTKDEFDKVVIEREALKEAHLKLEEEITRLKTDLAVLKRDRVNLQLAYDGLQREVTDLRAKAGGVEEVALAPKAAAAALAAQASAPDEEIRVDVPAAATLALPKSAPTAEPPPAGPAEKTVASEPAAPSLPKTPVPKGPPTPSPFKPFAPLPKAPAVAGAPAPLPTPAVVAKATGTAPVPTPVPKPASPLPAAPKAVPAGAKPGVPLPAAPAKPVGPAKAPPGLGSGVRPLAKPMGGTPVSIPNEAAALPDAPTTRLAPRPAPSVKLPAHPTVKVPAASAPEPKVGPKGTQKIS